MELLLTVIIGYLFGAIPTALIVGKKSKIDIRKHGSGNIGGTNTFRVLGKKAGFIVAIVDVLKGIFPTIIGLWIGGEVIAIFAGFSASIGHSYSIFAGLKGGKSVATSAGSSYRGGGIPGRMCYLAGGLAYPQITADGFEY